MFRFVRGRQGAGGGGGTLRDLGQPPIGPCLARGAIWADQQPLLMETPRTHDAQTRSPHHTRQKNFHFIRRTKTLEQTAERKPPAGEHRKFSQVLGFTIVL
jgi:hypothetical protein